MINDVVFRPAIEGLDLKISEHLDPTCPALSYIYIPSETQMSGIIDSYVHSLKVVFPIKFTANLVAMADGTMQRIYSKDIYHGLPELSHAPDGLTAVVTGANGISGSHMVGRLLKAISNLPRPMLTVIEYRSVSSPPILNAGRKSTPFRDGLRPVLGRIRSGISRSTSCRNPKRLLRS